jgi:EXS family
MGVEFSIVWMTDQWISMATPLRDLAYTVCYYTRLDFKTPSVNPCKNNATFEVVSLVVVIALSYRMLQCIRLGISQGNYFCSLNFANTIKYTLSLGAALISYVYNIGYVNLLWLWIVISAISTFYSYYWDLKNDWSLL